MSKHRTKFCLYLLKRYSTESLSEAAQAFANECEPSVSQNTILKWADGTKPRKFYRDILHPQFPDCPIFMSKSQTSTPIVEIQSIQP